jgi:hypothetical protein
MLAGGFGRVLVETGKARAVESGATLLDRFGERFGLGEQLGRLRLRRCETLFGLLLSRKGADLDDPAAAMLRLRRRR